MKSVILTILFWVFLALAFVLPFIDWPYGPRVSNVLLIVLLIIIGLALFPIRG